MIKNVVFDYGQVLCYFDEKYIVYPFVEKEDRELVSKVVLDRLYWDRLDAGTISNEEAVSKMQERLPQRLWDAVEKIYYGWIDNRPEVEGMRELICYIKEKYGVKCYLLSNISKYFAENKHRVPILSLLDGYVFSGPIGITKPGKEIYQHLLDKFQLKGEETIFIDDKKENIDGALACGIGGYVFDGDAKKLKAYLETILN
ncbi:MAG: HAD family phosphatase [Clostridia bacterium]|nr:HAD family phosphatase [Clostridia bacterium]